MYEYPTVGIRLVEAKCVRGSRRAGWVAVVRIVFVFDSRTEVVRELVAMLAMMASDVTGQEAVPSRARDGAPMESAARGSDRRSF